jgi:hypothetical protein
MMKYVLLVLAAVAVVELAFLLFGAAIAVPALRRQEAAP